MMNEGFNCRNNHYSYALTVTAAGHASAYTGSIPAINGIVGNEWYDPIAKQDVYCVEDSTVKTVGSNNVAVGKMSPKNLLVSTVTDQLRIATNFRSKTIGVAIKDRGSILPAGHAANAAYWFDSKTGNWVSSTYYMDDLPQWAKDYNAKKMPAAYAQKGWDLLLTADAYTQSSADDVAWEGKLPGAKRPVFPYELVGMAGDAFGIVTDTPWGNTIAALIFAIGFGLIPGYFLSLVLKMFGLLRVDPKVELTGLDGDTTSATYPHLSGAEAAFEALQRKEAKT